VKYLKLKFRYPFVLLLLACTVFAGCKKAKQDITENLLQQYFDNNILNRDFRVKLATQDGVDLTTNFTGYVFRLLKTENSNYNGAMTAKRNDSTYTGTWGTNDDFGRLDISITSPSSTPFLFLNRSWRFTKKALPVMELAPWGSTDPIVLHMERL